MGKKYEKGNSLRTKMWILFVFVRLLNVAELSRYICTVVLLSGSTS